MATVFGVKRTPVGKLAPHPSGAIAAQIGSRRIGLFTNADLAIAAILDLTKRPIEVDGLLVWLEELLAEEPVADGTATYAIDADLM
jgi:hypothetical protein